MAQVNKIDSNVTNLAYAFEASAGVLPGTPVWVPLEPNGYNNFGGNLTRLTRQPITSGRQRKKGVVSDLEASGGFSQDLTQKNLADLMPAVMFADYRLKGEAKNALGITTNTFSVTAASSRITRVGGAIDLSTQFAVGDLVFVSGFAASENNGLFAVSAVTATTMDLAVVITGSAASMSDEAATANASIVQVGVEGNAGDLEIDASGNKPQITSTVLDLTTFGLIPGEIIYIGGDNTAAQFATSANNGYARVRSVATNAITLDKTEGTMVTDNGSGKQIHIYTGRVLKNEVGSLVKKKPIQLERQLGAPDDAQPNNIQSEYLTASLANEANLQIPTAGKVTYDFGFVSATQEVRTATQNIKSGTRVAASEITGDAFNTSNSVPRIKLNVVDENDSNPSALFAYAEALNLNINNGVTPDKAIGVLGGFDTSIGDFAVSGDMTVYFADIAAVEAVRANSDVTLDFHLYAANAGISWDVPLIALGNAQADIQVGQSIKLPLGVDAATAEGIDTNLNHTLLMVFFDYLPTLAAS